jgi:hypothetical protein
VHIQKSKYTSGGWQHTKPFDYEITWETATIQVIMLEYRNGDDVSYPVQYSELYVVNESLVPVIGTGCVTIDDEFQFQGDYLRFSDMNSQLEETQKDFNGEIHIPSEGKSLHIGKM